MFLLSKADQSSFVDFAEFEDKTVLNVVSSSVPSSFLKESLWT